MHDKIWQLFDSNTPGAYGFEAFSRLATGLALDLTQFQDCYNSAITTTAITELEAERLRLGINSTPTLILNGQVVSGNIETAVSTAVGSQ